MPHFGSIMLDLSSWIDQHGSVCRHLRGSVTAFHMHAQDHPESIVVAVVGHRNVTIIILTRTLLYQSLIFTSSLTFAVCVCMRVFVCDNIHILVNV